MYHTIKNLYNNGILIILAAAITFSPRFPITAIAYQYISKQRPVDIRAEDILLLLITIGIVLHFLISKESTTFKKPPLFIPIILWIGFGIITSLSNYIFRSDVSLIRTVLFILKHIEYLLIYFYVFARIKTTPDVTF